MSAGCKIVRPDQLKSLSENELKECLNGWRKMIADWEDFPERQAQHFFIEGRVIGLENLDRYSYFKAGYEKGTENTKAFNELLNRSNGKMKP